MSTGTCDGIITGDNDSLYHLFIWKEGMRYDPYIQEAWCRFFALLLIAALAACGNHSESKGSSSDSKDEETVTYKAENGNVKIPKHPKRVVVMADGYYGDFKTLGINVVGAPENVFKNPYYKGKTDGVTNIGDGTSVEKVIDLKPDLIIVWTTQGADIKKLEKSRRLLR